MLISQNKMATKNKFKILILLFLIFIFNIRITHSCLVPDLTNPNYLNSDTVLCNGIYTLNMGSPAVGFITSNDNIFLDCNGSTLKNGMANEGLWIEHSNITIKNCIFEDFTNLGIYIRNPSDQNVQIQNSTFNNIRTSIKVNGDNHIIENNSFYDMDWGILFEGSDNVTVKDSIFDSAVGTGIEFVDFMGDPSSNNIIYNNKFNCSYNIIFNGNLNNHFNTTKFLTNNIINGTHIGGNFWSDYNGNDTNLDGIGESAHKIDLWTEVYDYLPLTNNYVNTDSYNETLNLSIGPNQSLFEGKSLTLNISFNYNSSFEYNLTINWGDGYISNSSNLNTGTFTSTKLMYNQQGSYTINVTLNSSSNKTESKSIIANVSNALPIISGDDEYIVELGLLTNLNMNYSDYGLFDTHYYNISWGDSNYTYEANGNFTSKIISNTYNYSNVGKFLGFVNISDNDGGNSLFNFTVFVKSCGNSILDEKEDCDGTLFANKTCSDYGFNFGSLSCNSNCQIVSTTCYNSSGSSGGGSSSKNTKKEPVNELLENNSNIIILNESQINQTETNFTPIQSLNISLNRNNTNKYNNRAIPDYDIFKNIINQTNNNESLDKFNFSLYDFKKNLEIVFKDLDLKIIAKYSFKNKLKLLFMNYLQ